MKKFRKQKPKNKDSESWDVPFSRVYYKPSLISILRSYQESHIQSNEEMKMEMNIMEDQNKQMFKLIDVKGYIDKLEAKQIVDLVMKELYIQPSFEQQLLHIRNKLQSFSFKQEEQR